MTEHRGRGNCHADSGDSTAFWDEFRLLADSVVAGVEPIIATFVEGWVRARTSTSSDESPAFSGCVGCPVCAVAAVGRGERHELRECVFGHAAAAVSATLETVNEFFGERVDRRGGGQAAGRRLGCIRPFCIAPWSTVGICADRGERSSLIDFARTSQRTVPTY